MNILCVLFTIFCMGEPETMPVHKTSIAIIKKPQAIILPIAKSKITQVDSFQCNIKTPKSLRRHYIQAARRYRLTACELAKQGKAESNFNPTAISPAGAIGISQFLPSTAKEWGVDPLDVRSSIFGQAKYVRWCRNRWVMDYGRTQRDIRALGLACYNWGIGNMRKSQSKYGWVLYEQAERFLPSETKRYVEKIEG